MKEEIQHATHFLCEKLKENKHLSDEQCELFGTTLESLMLQRFRNHWHPDKPLKGNAYRCININHEECVLDPMLKEAANESFIDAEDIKTTFPKGLALWVDPFDVSYRYGRKSICPIFKKYNSSKPFSNSKNSLVDSSKKATVFQLPNTSTNMVFNSKLNTSAPSFVPTTRVTQDLSSIWPTNYHSFNSGQDFYSHFRRYPEEKMYDRYHWHRNEKDQHEERRLANQGFEFRNVAQEVY